MLTISYDSSKDLRLGLITSREFITQNHGKIDKGTCYSYRAGFIAE